MNKQELMDLGIEDDELLQKIIVMHGKDIEKFKGLAEEKDRITSQLEEAMNKISELSPAVEKVQEFENLQSLLEQTQLESQDMLNKVRMDYEIKLALKDARAKNVRAVRALIDESELIFDEDTDMILGLDEQLENIKNESDFLFDSDRVQIQPLTGIQHKDTLSDSLLDSARTAAGLK